jgi:3-hydroxybutyryl-CoA dehydrogenase
MIKKIGVCGAGTMGSGIAQVAAISGYTTVLYDVDASMVNKGKSAIEKNLANQVEKKKLTPEQRDETLQRLSFTANIADCVADLLIEAIVERIDAKTDLFRQLATLNPPETILASNTSSLSLGTIAAAIPDAGRFAGMHFFNPAPLMKLVELVFTSLTRPDTLQTLMAVAQRMGKTGVICRDAPGFIVNHVARPFYLEALRLMEEGIGDRETIDSLLEGAGFRMGPFRLMDLIGNDINYSVSCSVYEALGRPDRLRPSTLQEQMVREGALGRKTGKGYYRYEQ